MANVDFTLEDLKAVFVTKDDLRTLATKAALKTLATKDELKNLATKDDLKKLATKEELQVIANDVRSLATDLRDTESRLAQSIEGVKEMLIEDNQAESDRLDRIDRRLKRLRRDFNQHAASH